MDLDIYRNFLAIVEAGSFTGAADFVHIAQPALSKQLRNLENFFGTKLIITPHMSWASVESRNNVRDKVATNIRAFLNGTEDGTFVC